MDAAPVGNDSPAGRIGFMQGRLSDLIDCRIQAFPWLSWQEEFAIAHSNGFRLMEWTLDQARLQENPLMLAGCQWEIHALMIEHHVSVPSVTGDCFMQAPFWKAQGSARTRLGRVFRAVAAACRNIGISMLVVPLVDNGRIETAEQENVLLQFLHKHQAEFEKLGLRVLFESDLGPNELARFIGQLDADTFGINYDTGNSAALGYDADEEIDAYGSRIVNVHVKDRELSGTTVPLGAGAANFDKVFAALRRANYEGNFILQAARASDNDHAAALNRYRDMTTEWLRHA